MFETSDFHYDTNDVTRFFWDKTKGIVIESASVEFLNFCKEYIESEKVLRDDGKEPAELVVAYLSSRGVKIRKPGAAHLVRFLGKAIYYLKLQLLSNQIKFLQEDKLLLEEINTMAEFIACFYAKCYLQSGKAIKAPYLDILLMHKMHLYKDVYAKPNAIETVLKSFYKHSWYLDFKIVPLSLLDKNVSNEK